MADEVTLLPCVRCKSPGKMNLGYSTIQGVGYEDHWVSCANRECPIETGTFESDEEAAEAWNTMGANTTIAKLEAALAAKDARIAASGVELEDVRDRIDAVKKSLLQRDKVLGVQRERIAELEAELAALKKSVGQGHDVDAFYQPEACKTCKWGSYTGRVEIWCCTHPTGHGKWTGCGEALGCDKWEAEEES
jgi:hypothetical protein